MRDSTVRVADPGMEVTAEVKEGWKQRALQFLNNCRKADDEAKEKELPAKVRQPNRVQAYNHLIALDHMVQCVLPTGLLLFAPSKPEDPFHCPLPILSQVCLQPQSERLGMRLRQV